MLDMSGRPDKRKLSFAALTTSIAKYRITSTEAMDSSTKAINTSNDAMDTSTDKVMPLTNALPWELRRMVWQYTVASPDFLRLNRYTPLNKFVEPVFEGRCRSDTESISELDGPVSESSKTNKGINALLKQCALLQTCTQIREEAEQPFLEQTTFHFSINTIATDPAASITSLRPILPFIHHLSIDISALNYRRCTECCTECSGFCAEGVLAEHLDYITAHAPSLQTFTLHFLSSICCAECGLDYFDDTLGSLSLTRSPAQEALSKLVPKVRDRFTMVSYAREEAYVRHRSAIAPADGWRMELLQKWPGITLSEREWDFVEDCSRNSDDSYDHDEDVYAIRAWHYWPETSRSKVQDAVDIESRAAQEKFRKEWEKEAKYGALVKQIGARRAAMLGDWEQKQWWDDRKELARRHGKEPGWVMDGPDEEDRISRLFCHLDLR